MKRRPLNMPRCLAAISPASHNAWRASTPTVTDPPFETEPVKAVMFGARRSVSATLSRVAGDVAEHVCLDNTIAFLSSGDSGLW